MKFSRLTDWFGLFLIVIGPSDFRRFLGSRPVKWLYMYLKLAMVATKQNFVDRYLTSTQWIRGVSVVCNQSLSKNSLTQNE